MADEVFEKMQAEIAAVKVAEDQARSIHSQMVAAGCFDAEDLAVVNQLAASQGEKASALSKTLEIKRGIYQNSLQKLESSLRDRVTVLQSNTAALRQFPEILQYFAKKQASLEDQIAAVKESILK